MLSSTKAATLVLSTFFTTSPFITHSQTTDLPLPSIQFTAAAFLSEQKFPAKPKLKTINSIMMQTQLNSTT
nr:hypothetical protein CFP56_26337 [Quercus suber]